MADGRHFENHYIYKYLSRESSEFDEIWYADANFDQGDGNVTKIQKFPNSRWRRKPYWKSFFGYNSAPYCPIKTKLVGVLRHNCTHTKVRWWKCPISKIQHGGRPPFWKSLYLHISAANRPNFTKLSVQTQILSQVTETWQNSEICKFKMTDGRRIENHFLAITQLHIIPLRWNLEWGGTITRI